MTDEEKRLRTFVAVDLDAVVLERVRALQESLAASRADVRWVDNSSLHITLKFLGSTREHDLPAITAAIDRVARTHRPFPIELHGLGAFPSLRRPRVLWMGVRDGGKLADAARQLDEALTPVGFAPESRPFQPHLTLCRVRSLHRWEALEEKVKEHLGESFGQSLVREFILYRSDLRPSGAVYTPLWKTPLGEEKGEDT